MKMRPSRVLEKLRAGKVASCFKLNLESARAAEIAAMAGFDCLWNDREHVGNDWSHIESQIWAAKSQNVDVVVRVSRGSYSDYIRPLELDATGIMVPHLMGLEDAKNIVRMTRFGPLGLRAVDGGNADGAYGQVDFQEYLQTANRERLVIAQIEDPQPLEELDAIAALEGIDMLFFGPGDFSHAIGAPGDFSHPRVLEARQRVADACRANGKWAGTVSNPGNVAELIEMGYSFLNIGADVIALGNYCREMFALLNNAAQDAAQSTPAVKSGEQNNAYS
jgi:4-hydroxy-2-oxoheptanedioate aldolase